MNSRRDGGVRVVLVGMAGISLAIGGCDLSLSSPYRGREIRRLTAQLQQGDDATRLDAICKLAPIVDYCAMPRYMDLRNLAATRARPLLTKALLIALCDANPQVRVAAAKLATPEGCGHWMKREVVEGSNGFLQQLAEDEEAEVRLVAIHCYDHHFGSHDEAVAELAKLAVDDVDLVRERAVPALVGRVWCQDIPASAEDAMRAAAPRILQLLQNYTPPSDLDPLALSCYTLMRIPDRDTLVSLLTLLNTPEGAEGISLWPALGADADIAALLDGIERFEDLLVHEDARIREAAIRLLAGAEGTTPDSVPRIVRAMKDPAGNVRAAAAAAMIDSHCYSEALAELGRLLQDPEVEVRMLAIAAHRSMRCGGPDGIAAMDRLQQVAQSAPEQQVQEAAAEAVAYLRRQ
jgi:hypothetical protein